MKIHKFHHAKGDGEINVNLDQLTTYWQNYDMKHNVNNPDQTYIVLSSGQSFTLEISEEEFEKILIKS